MVLYRAVSLAELRDVRDCGRLRACPSGCEGKHLASTLDDARRWGAMLYAHRPFAVLRIEIADDVAAGMARWDRLDGIGPAFFATIEQAMDARIEEVNE